MRCWGANLCCIFKSSDGTYSITLGASVWSSFFFFLLAFFMSLHPALFFVYMLDPLPLILPHIFILTFLFVFSFLYSFSFWGVFVVIWLGKGALGLGFFGYFMTERRIVVVFIVNIIIIISQFVDVYGR